VSASGRAASAGIEPAAAETSRCRRGAALVDADEIVLLVIAAVTILDTALGIRFVPDDWCENATKSAQFCWLLVLVGIFIRAMRRWNETSPLMIWGVVLASLFWQVIAFVGLGHIT